MCWTHYWQLNFWSRFFEIPVYHTGSWSQKQELGCKVLIYSSVTWEELRFLQGWHGIWALSTSFNLNFEGKVKTCTKWKILISSSSFCFCFSLLGDAVNKFHHTKKRKNQKSAWALTRLWVCFSFGDLTFSISWHFCHCYPYISLFLPHIQPPGELCILSTGKQCLLPWTSHLFV